MMISRLMRISRPKRSVVVGWGYRDCRSLPVEAAKDRAQAGDVGARHGIAPDHLVEPAVHRQALHPHQPIDHLSRSAMRACRDTGFRPAATSGPQRPDTRLGASRRFNRTSVREFVSLAFSVEKSRWGSRAGFLSLYTCRSVRNTHDRCVSMTSTSMGLFRIGVGASKKGHLRGKRYAAFIMLWLMTA